MLVLKDGHDFTACNINCKTFSFFFLLYNTNFITSIVNFDWVDRYKLLIIKQIDFFFNRGEQYHPTVNSHLQLPRVAVLQQTICGSPGDCTR